MFAVCANVMAPADGRVVALDYGCGAHSEVQVDEVMEDVVDEVVNDVVDDVVDEGAAAEALADEFTFDDEVMDDAELALHPEPSHEHEGSAAAESTPYPQDDDVLEVVGVLPDDADTQDTPMGAEIVTEPVEPVAPAKRRGRGWLRGRLT
jgi:hypothetical protein